MARKSTPNEKFFKDVSVALGKFEDSVKEKKYADQLEMITLALSELAPIAGNLLRLYYLAASNKAEVIIDVDRYNGILENIFSECGEFLKSKTKNIDTAVSDATSGKKTLKVKPRRVEPKTKKMDECEIDNFVSTSPLPDFEEDAGERIAVGTISSGILVPECERCEKCKKYTSCEACLYENQGDNCEFDNDDDEFDEDKLLTKVCESDDDDAEIEELETPASVMMSAMDDFDIRYRGTVVYMDAETRNDIITFITSALHSSVRLGPPKSFYNNIMKMSDSTCLDDNYNEYTAFNVLEDLAADFEIYFRGKRITMNANTRYDIVNRIINRYKFALPPFSEE